MNTFILQWRPSISSYKIEDFTEDLHFLEFGEFNWSVFEWEKAHSGDNFYMVKCGEGTKGIVMKGFFTSEPYEADDWSGRDRQVHYMDMRPTYMFHPDRCPLIGTRQLEQLIPRIQWDGGHSGRLLDNEYAMKLDSIFENYLSTLDGNIFDQVRADRNLIPEAGIDDAVSIVSEALYSTKDSNGKPAILKALTDGLAGRSDEEKIVGFLRPVLKDPDYSAGGLRQRGFSERIVDLLLGESIPTRCL